MVLSTRTTASRLIPIVADDLVELRRLVGRGVTPSAIGLLPKYSRLVERLIAQHGDLAAARVAASVGDPTRTSRPKSLLKVLRALGDRGVELTAQRLGPLGEQRLLEAVRRAFGSLQAALAAMDDALVKEPRWRQLSADETMAAIRDRADDAGTVSRVDLDADTRRAARKVFGGVVPAIQAAGLTLRRSRRRAIRKRRPIRRRPAPKRSPAVRGARRGLRSVDGLALNPEVTRVVLDDVARGAGLSIREGHVLAAHVYGVPRSRVPEALGVGENTVKTYVGRVLRKLGVTGMDDAVWRIRTLVRRRVAASARVEKPKRVRALGR